jgi:hypothetical protein
LADASGPIPTIAMPASIRNGSTSSGQSGKSLDAAFDSPDPTNTAAFPASACAELIEELLDAH